MNIALEKKKFIETAAETCEMEGSEDEEVEANLVNHHILGMAIIKLSHHRCNVVISKVRKKLWWMDREFKIGQIVRRPLYYSICSLRQTR